MNNLKISSSGVRGKAPQDLSPEVCVRAVTEYSSFTPTGPLVVSRDSRETSPLLHRVVINTLQNLNREVIDIGLSPLPTTQVSVPHFKAAGGVMVTASHNPAEYNGLKFLSSEGEFITPDETERIKRALEEAKEVLIPKETVPPQSREKEAHTAHLDLFPKGTFEGIRVVLDAVNGAGSLIIPKLLEQLGCSVVCVACNPEQPFPHTPEPRPENLVWTQEQIQNLEFDIGFVVDPDADRLVLINEKGEIVSEEMTLALATRGALEKTTKGTLVINQSTSSLSEIIAREAGWEVHHAPVGEPYVVSLMKETEATLGGEGNGGVIDPDYHYGRDSLVGIFHILTLLKKESRPLSHIISELPERHITKFKAPPTRGFEEIYTSLEDEFTDALRMQQTDGRRFDFTDTSWIHIHPSNTEPVVRIFAESSTKEESEQLVDRAKKYL